MAHAKTELPSSYARLHWTALTSSTTPSATVENVQGLNNGRRPCGLYLDGFAGGAVLQAQGRMAGTSDDLNNISGMIYTADGVYSVDLPEGLEIAWNITGGSGAIEISLFT